MSRLILVTGPPGSGKTTLAREIGARYALPCLHKDDIKERLFESLGWNDRDWSKRLGLATYDLLYYTLELLLVTGRPALVECNFSPGMAEPYLAPLIERFGYSVLQIVCGAEVDVLNTRVQARFASGTRHPGHSGGVPPAHMELTGGTTPFYALHESYRLDLPGEVLELDMTDFSQVDYEGLYRVIEAFCCPRD